MSDDPDAATGWVDRRKKAIAESKPRIALGVVLLAAAAVVPIVLAWPWVPSLAFRAVVGILGLGFIVGSGVVDVFRRDVVASERGHERDGGRSDLSALDDHTGGDGDRPVLVRPSAIFDSTGIDSPRHYPRGTTCLRSRISERTGT